MKTQHLITLFIAGLAAIAVPQTSAKEYAMKFTFKTGATAVEHELSSVTKLTFSDADSANLVVNTDNGTTRNVIGYIQHVTFSDGKMIITTSTGTTEHAIPSVSKIDFDLSATGIDNVCAEAGDLSVAVSSGILTVNSNFKEEIILFLFDVNGGVKGFARGNGTAALDLSNLSNGVYIVRANNTTFKIER